LPISIVAMYFPEWAVTTLSNFELNGSDCLSSSRRSLLADTNAISIPEKNADRITVIIISIK